MKPKSSQYCCAFVDLPFVSQYRCPFFAAGISPLPGEFADPELHATVQDIVSRARAAGRHAGILAMHPGDLMNTPRIEEIEITGPHVDLRTIDRFGLRIVVERITSEVRLNGGGPRAAVQN